MFGCGDPVDMATGNVLLEEVDLSLPGVLPLRIARNYLSSYDGGRGFGPHWFSTLDQRIVVSPEGVVMVWDDGVLQQFPHPTGRADGRTASLEYAAPGLVSRFVDFDGSATAYEHDDFGAVVAVTDPLAATTHVSWTPRACRLP